VNKLYLTFFVLCIYFCYLWKEILKSNDELGTTFITKRQGDNKGKRLRVEQDDTRLGFEVDYDRIIFFCGV
jgi:hypothetical protein